MSLQGAIVRPQARENHPSLPAAKFPTYSGDTLSDILLSRHAVLNFRQLSGV